MIAPSLASGPFTFLMHLPMPSVVNASNICCSENCISISISTPFSFETGNPGSCCDSWGLGFYKIIENVFPHLNQYCRACKYVLIFIAMEQFHHMKNLAEWLVNTQLFSCQLCKATPEQGGTIEHFKTVHGLSQRGYFAKNLPHFYHCRHCPDYGKSICFP